jgi:hypothetical protein
LRLLLYFSTLALIGFLVSPASFADLPKENCIGNECHGPIETYLDSTGETYFPFISKELLEKCNIVLVPSYLLSKQSALSFLASSAPVVALFGDPNEINLPETIKEKLLPSLLDTRKARIQIGGELFLDLQTKEILAVDLFNSGCEDTSCISLFLFVSVHEHLWLECVPVRFAHKFP